MSGTRRSRPSTRKTYKGRHKFEHWYRDNQVYFITARCRGKFPAFASEAAKAVFWDRFEHYTKEYGFVPWVTSLMDNHYHTLGYLRVGANLGPMMQHIHGSVAKLVNDILEAQHRSEQPRLSGAAQLALNDRGRLIPFWKQGSHHDDYFDGCLRDDRQCRLAYRYTLIQAQRHRIVTDYRLYPHTKVNIDLDRGVARALQLHAFLEGVPYKRYQGPRSTQR
ncbi:MAG: hypothetical protein WD042_17200 [Phycisphaeraceae bacterium]